MWEVRVGMGHNRPMLVHRRYTREADADKACLKAITDGWIQALAFEIPPGKVCPKCGGISDPTKFCPETFVMKGSPEPMSKGGAHDDAIFNC